MNWTGLIERWGLEEGSSTRIGTCGNYNLTDNGTVTSNTGLIGTASEHLAANSEYLSTTGGVAVPEWFTAVTASISGWMWRSNTGHRTTMGASGSNTRRLAIDQFTDGNIYIGCANGSTTYAQCANPTSINTWNHFAISFDGNGATNADKLKLWINGAAQSLSFTGGSLPTSLPNNLQGPFIIGRDVSAYSTGRFDEVTIWARVFTAQDIVDLYNGGAGLAFTAFDPLADMLAGNVELLRSFRSTKNNVVCLGDSITMSPLPQRLPNAIWGTWKQANGWSAISSGTLEQGAARPMRYVEEPTVTYPGGGGIVLGTRAGTNQLYGSYYHGLPVPLTQFHVGTDFVGGTNNRLLECEVLTTSGLDYATNPDWMNTAASLRIGFYTYKRNGSTHVSGIGVQSAAALTDSPIDLSGDVAGWNYHEGPLLAGDNFYFFSTADYTSGDKWLTLAGVRLFDPAADGSEMLPAVAEESWSVAGHANPLDTANGSGLKQYTQAEITAFLQAVVDKDKPLYVILWIAPEAVIAGVQAMQVASVKERWKAAAVANSIPFGGLICVTPWRTDEQVYSERLTEGMMTAATEDADGEIVAINLYGLTNGLLLDATDDPSAQAAWAAANGYDSIPTTAGNTIDLSDLNMLDGSVLHPSGDEAAYGFAWIVGNYIESLTSTGESVVFSPMSSPAYSPAYSPAFPS